MLSDEEVNMMIVDIDECFNDEIAERTKQSTAGYNKMLIGFAVHK